MQNAMAGILEGLQTELAAMLRAGLESVYWRQDHYPTGGIVESDERVDGGRKLYWPWCWPRTYILEPLLVAGQSARARRFLEYWITCQRPDGGWLHCYDVRDHSEYPGWPETDNVGYMLWHMGTYVAHTDDEDWLRCRWPAIERAAGFLEAKYNPELGLIWGQEEANIPGAEARTIRYSLHINCVCALGLEAAAELARRAGAAAPARRWGELAAAILETGVSVRLWDEARKTFAWGVDEDGERLTAPGLWMTLMPFWLFDRFDARGADFGDRLNDTLAYLRAHLYDRDPRVPRTYWFYDYAPVLERGVELPNRYSGSGVNIGGLPVLIHVLLKAGQVDHAREQLTRIIDLTSRDNWLLPEKVNTLTPGVIGDYALYPEGQYVVDAGNLLHLSFLLTLCARRAPELLRQASAAVLAEARG